MKKLLFILGLFLLGISCRDIEDCNADENLNYVVLRFYDKETKGTRKIGFVTTEVSSPYTFVPTTDSTAIVLPLNPEDTVVQYLFDSDTLDFVLRFRYDREISIFDPECAPSISYSEIDTLNQTFDSLAITGTVANRQIDTHFEAYF